MKQAVGATNDASFMTNVTHSGLKEHGAHKSPDCRYALEESTRGASG
jgi:hypothetical protein